MKQKVSAREKTQSESEKSSPFIHAFRILLRFYETGASILITHCTLHIHSKPDPTSIHHEIITFVSQNHKEGRMDSSGGVDDGKVRDEGRSCSRATGHVDRSAVQFEDLFGNDQTQSGAAFFSYSAIIPPIKAIEDMRKGFSGNPSACIADLNRDAFSLRC
jgi:hypothetical protein